MSKRPRATFGVAAELGTLVPGVGRWSAAVGALAFAASLAEAGMFVVLTGAADAAIRPERQLEFRGYEFELNVAIGVGLALLIVKVVLAVAGSAIGVTYARRVLESLRARLTNALLEAAPLLVQAEKGGMMQDRLTTWCERVAASTETFGSMVAATLSLGAFLLVAALVDFRAVVLLLLLGIVVMGAIRPIIRRIRHAADRLRAEANTYAGDVGETAMVGTEIAAFGVGREFGRSLDRSSARAAHAWWKSRLMTMVLPHAYQTITMIMLFVAVAYVAWDDSPAAPARLGAVVLLLIRCVGLGQQLITYRAQFVNALPFVTGVREELASLTAARNPPGITTVTHIDELQIDDLSFSYSDVPAIQGVSLKLARGASLAVVGPSGSGKTTLARLLLRHASPSSGVIRVDGVDLSDITEDSWASLTAPVSQQPMMVTGSIADNVRFFRQIELSDVERACAQAGILADITNLPAGFDTMLYPTSGPLSGGQRQRLALARALCAEPHLVVLDEPTSALDVTSERVIADALAALRGVTTTIVVAHRWATVAHCAQVLVLSDGRQLATGPINEVLEQSEFLRHMRGGGVEREGVRVD